MGRFERKYFKNEAQQAAKRSRDRTVGVAESEDEVEFESSNVKETLKRHDEEHENLDLLGEVYHIVKGGEKSSLNSCLGQKNSLGNTILHIAALYGNNEVVEQVARLAPHLLFELNSNEDGVLHVAARAGHISTLKELLTAYTSKQVEVAREWTKYLDLVDDVSPEEFFGDEKRQSFGLIKLIKKKNKQGNLVLHEAMMSSSDMATKIFQILEPYKKQDSQGRSLSKCCYEFALTEVNEAGESVLYLAVRGGHKDTVKQILDKCRQDVMPKGKLPLLPVIIKKDKGMLDTILSTRQGWIHLMDTQDRLPLHHAATLGFYDGVVYLLERCKSCSIQRDKYGFFPLHLASREGHMDVFLLLLQYCPDPTDMLDNHDRNVLHIAANSGMLHVVQKILETPGLEKLINQKDKGGNTPLHLAARKCHPKVVYALTWDHRVELDLVNGNNQTALAIVNALYPSSGKENLSLQQRLTWTALQSAGAKGSPTTKMLPVIKLKSNDESGKTETSSEKTDTSTEPLKDRIEALIVVSTLIITASVAACFSVPGEAEGAAHNLKHAMFQFFIFCITISLFSSISATIILFWARLGEIHLLG